MADELIRCPSCNHELRLPRELFGQTVECPQCGNRFAAPAPATAPPAVSAAPAVVPSAEAIDHEQYIRAADALRAPAVILLVLSILNAVMSGWSILSAREIVADPAAFEAQMHAEIDRQPNMSADDRARFKQIFSAQNIREYSNTILISVGVMFGLALITVLGSIQMLRVRAYALCIIGSIVALDPLNCPCCLFEFPIALWALIVLLRSDVRAAFR
jgi:hypothetical protein